MIINRKICFLVACTALNSLQSTVKELSTQSKWSQGVERDTQDSNDTICLPKASIPLVYSFTWNNKFLFFIKLGWIGFSDILTKRISTDNNSPQMVVESMLEWKIEVYSSQLLRTFLGVRNISVV